MDEKSIVPVDNNQIKPLKPHKEEPKKGRALKKWATFFFVLSCISFGLIIATLALPIFLAIVGIVSVIAWLVLLIISTIFTIGLIWTSESVRNLNQGWMELNDKLFNSSDLVYEFVVKVIPTMTIVGAIIIAITWVFLFFGIATDNNRKKFYRGMIIALGVISFLYLVATILSIFINSLVK